MKEMINGALIGGAFSLLNGVFFTLYALLNSFMPAYYLPITPYISLNFLKIGFLNFGSAIVLPSIFLPLKPIVSVITAPLLFAPLGLIGSGELEQHDIIASTHKAELATGLVFSTALHFMLPSYSLAAIAARTVATAAVTSTASFTTRRFFEA